jgi:hypothetical protein
MNHNKTKKTKEEIVLEAPDIEEIDLLDIKELKLEEINLKDFEMNIEDLELPGFSSRGVLVLGLLKNLMPGLNITPKKRDSWIQAFNRMEAAEISRIIALSHSEIYCRRAIEIAVKETEK